MKRLAIGSATAAFALATVVVVIRHGQQPAGTAGRAVVPAWCQDEPKLVLLDVRFESLPVVDGGLIDFAGRTVSGADLGDFLDDESGCAIIREELRQDGSDPSSWPAQDGAVRRVRTDPPFSCKCATAAGGTVRIPCTQNSGRHDISKEFGCAPGANAEPSL